MATKGGGELVYKVENDREFAVVTAAIMLAGEAWLDRSKRLNKVIETQVMRARMALCGRADMADVIREGDAMLGEDDEVGAAAPSDDDTHRA